MIGVDGARGPPAASQPSPGKPAEVLVPFLASAGTLLAAATAVVLLWPGSLSLVHQALERLVH